jgi:hypothetical protein
MKPRERGLTKPVRRGAVVPSGKVTLGVGVPRSGSLHLGANVLNDFASLDRKLPRGIRF